MAPGGGGQRASGRTSAGNSIGRLEALLNAQRLSGGVGPSSSSSSSAAAAPLSDLQERLDRLHVQAAENPPASETHGVMQSFGAREQAAVSEVASDVEWLSESMGTRELALMRMLQEQRTLSTMYDRISSTASALAAELARVNRRRGGAGRSSSTSSSSSPLPLDHLGLAQAAVARGVDDGAGATGRRRRKPHPEVGNNTQAGSEERRLARLAAARAAAERRLRAERERGGARMFDQLTARAEEAERAQRERAARTAPPPEADVLASVEQASTSMRADMDDEQCAVCLELTSSETSTRYGDGDDGRGAVVLPCKHAYHRSCIAQWVSHEWQSKHELREARKVSCPLCKVVH